MSVNKGDMFQLDNHLLACGDCTDVGLIKRLVGSRTISSIVCDPPYGVDYVESKKDFPNISIAHKPIANDDITSELGYETFSLKWLQVIPLYLTSKNSLYIFISDKMLFPLKEAMDKTGIHFGQLLIWVKNHSVVGRLDYLPQHELIIYGWHGTHEFHKAKDKSILYCPKPNKSTLHPTMKPISLLRRLILNSTKVGDYVYDGFGGSGSTLIACEQTKRKCLMVELDPDYCQVIINRFEKLTGIKAIQVT